MSMEDVSPVSPQLAAGKTILVADDESHILAVVSMKLRNAGYTGRHRP